MHAKFFSRINSARVFKGTFLLAAAIIVFLFPSAIFGQTQINDNWTTIGSGAWSNTSNWSSGVPNNNSSTLYNVLINNGTSANPTTVGLDISPTINDLTIGANNTLQLGFSGTQSLTIAGSSIVNSGTIITGGGQSLVIGSSDVTLSGGGIVTMPGGSIVGSTSSNILTNQETIQGTGNIGNGSMALNNSGTITANVNGHGLIIEASNGVTNTGTLEAANGGSLYLDAGTYSNTGGTIVNTGTGGIGIDNVTINGGTISQTSSGSISFGGNSTINASVSNSSTGGIGIGADCACGGGNITITGTLTNPKGGQISIADATLTITGSGSYNAGSIAMTGNDVTHGYLIIGTSNFTLTSTSSLQMSDVNETISASAADNTLTNQGLIEGTGSIGNDSLVLNNSGTVNANASTPLTIQGTGGVTNAGILEATDGGILILSGGTYNNAGGTIETTSKGTADSTIQINGAIINGGTLEAGGPATSTIELNSATINGAALKGVGGIFVSNAATINGGSNGAILQVPDGSSLTLAGDFTNTHQIQLGSTGDSTDLLISGNVTLAGAGTIIMSNNSNNVIQGASTGTEVLTNKNTIEGSGNIGNGFMGLVNSGTILANQSTALTIDPSSAGFSNSGKLTVNAGSTLNITGPANSFTDTGTVKILSGGTLAMGANLNYTQTKGTTTVDGMLSVTSANSINIQGGTLYGNNGTLDGNFSLSATGVLNPGDGSKKIGDLTIDGAYTQGLKSSLTIDIGGTTADTGYSVLDITDTASLSGKLTIDLVNGFTPTAGESFDILNYTSETGTFSTTNLPKLSGGDTWSISYNATDVVLTVDGPGAAAASPTATSTHNNVALPVRHAVAVHGAAIAGDDMQAPSAILTRAETCGGFRTFASLTCMREAVSSFAAGRFMNAVASHGTMASTLHNNVASVRIPHSNAVVSMSGSVARPEASHEPTVLATSVARFYVCAYMPDELARTMGCR